MTNFILFITLLAIIWYTIETKRLADLTAKQIKINIKPIIIVVRIVPGLILKNIGKSPAINITVNDVSRKAADRDDVYQFKFIQKTELGSNEERGLSIIPYCDNKPITASGKADDTERYFLDYNSLSDGVSYEIVINYNDIEMGKWESISSVDNKGVHFKEIKETKKLS